MSPEAQRIAIAEACGFRRQQFKGAKASFLEHPSAPYPWYDGPREEPTMPLAAEQGEEFQKMVPDYLNDLNAMHKAGRDFSSEKKGRFMDHITNIVRRDWRPDAGPMTSVIESYWATAAQRAEAFLRTLGLWKDDA